MKIFKLLTTTAITTMAVAALAVSASAMTATYVPAEGTETGKVTLSTELTADQRTLLVLNNDVFGDFAETAVANASVSEGDIVQIDQDASFSTVVVGDLQKAMNDANATALATYEASDKGTEAYAELQEAWQASKTYYVRVGGADTIEVASFTVATTAVLPDEPVVTPAYTLGDVNADTSINMGDAAAVLNHFMGYSEITDATAKLAADVNVDTSINMGDAAAILNHFMGYQTIVQPQ